MKLCTSEILAEIEEKFNLQELQIRGSYIWWYAKGYVASQIDPDYKKSFLVGAEGMGYRKLGFLKDIVTSKYKKVSKADVLCISPSNRRRYIKNSKNMNVFFDYLSEVKIDYLIYETLSSNGFYGNLFNKKDVQDGYVNVLINLGRKTYQWVLKKSEIRLISDLMTKVEDYLDQKYQLRTAIVEPALKQAAGLFLAKKYIEKKIRLIDPKVIFIDCAYSVTHRAFIDVAHSLDIPVVEFQHGIITDEHLGYFFNAKKPTNYPIPDMIVTFGNHFRKIITRKNNYEDKRVFVLGYPHLEDILSKYRGNDAYAQTSPKKILITTQGDNFEVWNAIIPSLAELLNNYVIIMRPHPNERHKYVQVYKEALLLPNVKCSTNIGILEDLVETQYHLSINSTAHLEAIAMGRRTIIVNGKGVEAVQFLEDLGIPKAFSSREIADIIENYPQCHYDQLCSELYSINSDHYTTKLKKLLSLLESKYNIKIF